MGELVQLGSGKTRFQSYLATPATGHGAGVIVLHAWWGLTDFFKSVADRSAREGFVSMAPDMFNGAQANKIEEAKRLRSEMKSKEANQKILSTIKSLAENRATDAKKGIGIIGFSLGGFYALGLSTQTLDVKAVTTFYAARKANYSSSKASFLCHFAEDDPYVSANSIREMERSLKSAGRTFDYHMYPGTKHWFFEENRKDAFNAKAAELAWARTIDFFRSNLI